MKTLSLIVHGISSSEYLKSKPEILVFVKNAGADSANHMGGSVKSVKCGYATIIQYYAVHASDLFAGRIFRKRVVFVKRRYATIVPLSVRFVVWSMERIMQLNAIPVERLCVDPVQERQGS